MGSKVIDLIGQRFGKLTVIERTTHNNHLMWVCKCECGKPKLAIDGSNLRSGRTLSCGCLKREKVIDLVGHQFGRWKVIKIASSCQEGIKWFCQCECGITRNIKGSALKRGCTKSCGCLAGQLIRQKHYRHGCEPKDLYHVWENMKHRCYNPNNPQYKDYGGRGISVGSQWRNDFVAFREHALVNGYQKGLEIDRIDNNGNYEPGNCQWVTHRVNMNNMNTHKRILCPDGVERTLSQVSEITGLTKMTLTHRLRRKPDISFAELTRPTNTKIKKAQ